MPRIIGNLEYALAYTNDFGVYFYCLNQISLLIACFIIGKHGFLKLLLVMIVGETADASI